MKQLDVEVSPPANNPPTCNSKTDLHTCASQVLADLQLAMCDTLMILSRPTLSVDLVMYRESMASI